VDRRSIRTASRKCTISGSRISTRCSWPIQPWGRARLRPQHFRFLYGLSQADIVHFDVRRPAVLQHATVRDADIKPMVSGRWREHGLAGQADQSRSQLLANRQRRRRFERSGAGEYRERLAAAAIDANPERINWSKLCEQQCSGRIAHIKYQWAYDLGKRLGAAPGRPTSESAAAIHASAPELQRYCSDIQHSRPKSRDCYYLVSVHEAARKVIRNGNYG
jgi:hypothetical protein